MNNERLYLAYLYDQIQKQKDTKRRDEIWKKIKKQEMSLTALGENAGR